MLVSFPLSVSKLLCLPMRFLQLQADGNMEKCESVLRRKLSFRKQMPMPEFMLLEGFKLLRSI